MAKWLGGASVWVRFWESRLLHSSVFVAVLGETVAVRLCKQEDHLAGLRHEVEPFEEARPDAFCTPCCAWGHVIPQCPAAACRCALCGEAR